MREKARTVSVSVEETFDAAHSIPGTGKCSNLHGHTWNVVVAIETQEENVRNGILVDFSHIKRTIQRYDHHNLNDFMKFPTAENLALAIMSDIESFIMFANAIEVTVYESPTSSATVRDVFYETEGMELIE